MIKINLLPEEYHKRKMSLKEAVQQYKSLIVPIVGLVIGVIVIVSLIVVVYPRWQAKKLRYFQTRWKEMKTDYKEAVELKKEENDLKDKLKIIDYITVNRLIWAAKLNQISDVLPGEIQLTEMTVETEKYKDKTHRDVLVIEGLVPAFPGERAIEEFIKDLKGNQGFSEDFPQIELPLTETTEEGVKKFILKCYLAEKYILEEDKRPKTEDQRPKKKKKR